MKQFFTLKLLFLWIALLAIPTVKSETWTTVYQSDFASNINGWTINRNGEGDGSLIRENNKLKFQITNPGALDYSVQLNFNPLELIKGEEYLLSFYVNSTSASVKPYVWGMQKNEPNWDGYTDYSTFTTATTGEKKEFRFRVNKETSSNIALAFNLGNNGTNTLYFSYIKLEKLDKTTEPEPDPDPTPENLTEPIRPASDIYSIFTDYSGGNKIDYSYTWEELVFLMELYTNTDNKTAYKIKWPAGMENWAGASVFHLKSNAFVSASDLANNYEYIHVDVWSNTDLAAGYLRLNFRDGTEKNFGLDKNLDKINAKTWTSYDIPLSDLVPTGNTKSLAELVFQRTNVGGESLIYMDNIYLYKKQQEDSTVPAIPAYLPPATSSRWGAENIVSVFSDSYENKELNLTFAPEKTNYNIDFNANHNTWKFANTQNVSIAGNMNVTGMNRFHIDVWTEEAKSFQIRLNGSTLYPSTGSYTSESGNWTSIDVELPNNLSAVNKVEILGSNATTYFIDNIYFYNHISAFDVDINAFNKSLGKGVNIGNTFDVNQNPWDFKYINVFDSVGLSHIRLPISLELNNRSMEEYPYTIKPEFLEEIKDIIDATLAKGMKIMIDFHHHDELKADPYGQWDRFLAQWKQVAEYFQYYPKDLVFELLNEPTDKLTAELWNSLLADGLEVVRKTNPTRPVVIGTAEWGGTTGLIPLTLPSTDEYLIVSIHYYNPFTFTHQGEEWMENAPPVGTEWLDTQAERDVMSDEFSLVDQFLEKDGKNRPFTVGEFGAFSKADIDSRVRWTTYLTRYFDQRDWSYTIWAHMGNFFTGEEANSGIFPPIVDALLKNPMPEPFDIKEDNKVVSTIYDGKKNGYSGFGYYGCSLIVNTDNLTVKITNGGSSLDAAAFSRKVKLEKGKSYQVSFTVSSLENGGFTFRNCFQNATNYAKYSDLKNFVPTTEPTTHSYTFTMNGETDLAAEFLFNVGGTGTTPVTLYFEDFLIEEIEAAQVLPTAPAPTASDITAMTAVYSSASTNNPTVNFSDAANVIRSKDSDNNQIIQFTNYTEQSILTGALAVQGKKTLHLEILAGSPFPLKITVINTNNEEASATYDLPSHSWYSIDMDLSDILENGNGNISQIRFSGGIGIKRKLYLDHIYLINSPVTATWNGSDNNWNNAANWSTNKIPNNNTDITLNGGLSIYPTIKEGDNATVNNIILGYGAELGGQHLLTYNKAFVEFDLNAGKIARDRYYFITAPLQDMVSGDFFFGGKPDVWVRYAQVIGLEETNTTTAISELRLTKNLSSYKIDLTPGFGFAYRVVGEEGDNKTQTNLENNGNKLLLPRFENEKDGNDKNSNFYSPIYGYNQHEVWHADENTSYFYYFYSDNPDDRAPETIRPADKKVRTKDSNGNWFANRFITETITGNSLNLSGITSGQDLLMGNIFMSHLDFVKFYKANTEVIENYFKIYNGNSIEHYYIIGDKVYTDSNGNTEADESNALIAPMQSFFIKAIDNNATSLSVNITPDMTIAQGGYTLRSNNERSEEKVLSITLTSNHFESTAVLLCNEETIGTGVPKLFSNLSLPEVFIIQDKIAKAITEIDETTKSVALGIRKGIENMKFSFSGIDNFTNTEISLYDNETGITYPLTKESNSISFSKSDNDEKRFYISFKPMGGTSIDSLDTFELNVYVKESSIMIISDPMNPLQKVTIYNTQGILLDHYNNLSTNSFQTTKNFDKGIYIVEVETEMGKQVKKVVIK